MPRLLKTILTITIILIDTISLNSQVIRGLAYNHAIIKAIEEGDKNYQKDLADSIHFDNEFFEDFSDYGKSVFPRKNYWADNYAYINSTFADSMISLGVATLDAYNDKGYPYYSSSYKIVPSDSLTSLPFSFQNNISSTYFFSFFYQAGGKGDMPEGIISDEPGVEGMDSLLLDFYSVEHEQWVMAFYTLDNTDTFHFKQVILELPDTLLEDGFRFRFRNYTSLPKYPQGQDLGMFGNADQWHIDYIQMKQVQSSQVMENLNDIMVVEPLLPSFTEYTAVPWRHFTIAQSVPDNERRQIPFSFRTYYPGRTDPIDRIDRFYRTTNLSSGTVLKTKNFHNDEEPAFHFFNYQDNFTTDFFYNPSDTIGRLEIAAFIETTEGDNQIRINDTVRRMETYYDHYAYDDGSAELGFGIGGESQEKSRIALRFRSFHNIDNPDSLLKAVLIYFCKSVDTVTDNVEYRISIRKNDDELPAEDELYSSDIYTPEYDAGLNEFTRIEIDPPLPISDTFFIVIEQLNGYLNLGYDINNDNLRNLYVYTNQIWNNPYSITRGSLMVRASFGNYSLPPSAIEDRASDRGFIYPNPANDFLNYSPAPECQGPFTMEIYNVSGSVLYQATTDETSIPVGNLSKGLYFIVITPEDKKSRFTATFIKQ